MSAERAPRPGSPGFTDSPGILGRPVGEAVWALPLSLFPLQTVLFPGGVLPLRIFEVRYLDMIARCHRDQLPFGVVCLQTGSEVRDPRQASATLHGVGTLAHVVHFEQKLPGLVLVECRGGHRFRLGRHAQETNGLWRAQSAELLPPDALFDIPEDLQFLRRGLRSLAGHQASFIGEGSGGPLGHFPDGDDPCWNDCGWVANRWCELLPVAQETKQRCMMLDTPVLRLELVADLLDHLGIRAEDPAAPA